MNFLTFMIIISFKPGRLANRLIQFANFIAYSIEYNVGVFNPSFDEYTPYFEGTEKNSFGFFPKKYSLKYQSSLNKAIYNFALYSCRFLHRFRINNMFIQSIYLEWDKSLDLLEEKSLHQKNITFVHGWLFKGGPLIKKHQETVRSFFSPIRTIRENVTSFIESQKRNSEILVGVHIRRGDYKTFKNGIYYYSNEQYIGCMQHMANLFEGKRVRFVLCSNESLDSFRCDDIDFVCSTLDFVEDLYLLSECNYIIGPPSTFSIWASFYGKAPYYHIENIDEKFFLSNFNVGLID